MVVVRPNADSPGYKSVALAGMHSDGPGGRAAGTAERWSPLGQRLSHRRPLHQPRLTQRTAVDTVGLGASRKRSYGHLPGCSPAPAYLSVSLDCSSGPCSLCPALPGLGLPFCGLLPSMPSLWKSPPPPSFTRQQNKGESYSSISSYLTDP